jgi:hypothetical protein
MAPATSQTSHLPPKTLLVNWMAVLEEIDGGGVAASL